MQVIGGGSAARGSCAGDPRTSGASGQAQAGPSCSVCGSSKRSRKSKQPDSTQEGPKLAEIPSIGRLSHGRLRSGH